MIYQGKARYPVREVVLHTSATRGGWANGKTAADVVTEIRRWHTDPKPQGRGWSDIGYHRVIMPDGEVGIGRSLWTIGAHTVEANRGTVGICLIPVKTVPNVLVRGATFDDYYTPAQRSALCNYLRELRALTPIERVTGHNDYAAKACPGFKVNGAEWLVCSDG